jgi:hypothetical protein
MGQMNEVVELDECRDEIGGGRYPPRSRAGKSNSGGGDGMDDVLKRLGAVETAVSETKVQVGAIAATLPHLATKDDVRAVRVEVAEVRTEVRAIAAVIPHLATKADLKDVKTEIGAIAAAIPHLATKADLGAVRAEIAELGTKLISWLVATGIATAGLVVTAMKFVH